MDSPARFKRRRILIQPRLQMRIVLALVGVACISSMVQVVLLSYSLTSLAENLPFEGSLVLEELPGIVLNQVLLSLLLTVPLMLAVGTLATFRVVGPLYRIERYLLDVAAGAKPAPCKIRKGDELQEFCQVVNAATQPFVTAQAPSAATPATKQDPEPRSLVGESVESKRPTAAK